MSCWFLKSEHIILANAHNPLPPLTLLEHDVAENDELLEEMIKVASNIGGLESNDEEDGPLLDKFTFAHCLTNDVRGYDIKNENRLSTHYADVFDGKDEVGSVDDGVDSECNSVKTVWTAPAIDYAVDTFRTKSYVILLWANWAIFFFVYMWGNGSQAGRLSCSSDTTTASGFGCQVAQGT